MHRASASSPSLYNDTPSTSANLALSAGSPGGGGGAGGGAGAILPPGPALGTNQSTGASLSSTDKATEKVLPTRSFTGGGGVSGITGGSIKSGGAWSHGPPGFGLRALGIALLVLVSLYAGADLVLQVGLEQGFGDDDLPGGSSVQGSAGIWGSGQDERLPGTSVSSERLGMGTSSSNLDSWRKTRSVEGRTLARQVVGASAYLHSLLKTRLDDNLAMLMPAMRLLSEQEAEEAHQLGRFSTSAVAGWLLRVGHWVRPAPGLVWDALDQGNVPSLEKQRQMLPNPSRRLFLPCARQYRGLDEILLQPHGCSPGERRYFHSGVWMDWDMLYRELSRPGGGGGHNYNDAVCVVVCVDRPQPLCSSLSPERNKAGAVGFPCVHLFALRQQRNVSTDAKELAEVYEAEFPLPWVRLSPANETRAQDKPAQQPEVGESNEGSGEEGHLDAGEQNAEGGGEEVLDEGTPVLAMPQTWAGAVLDAGAGIGITSVYLSNLYPGRLIVSLEANTKAFKLLKHNCQAYPSIVPWNAMMWPPPEEQQPAPTAQQQEQQETRNPPPPAMVGPLVDGAFLLRVFGMGEFEVIRLNLRQGGEEFLFPSLRRLRQQQATEPALLAALKNMQASSLGDQPTSPPSLSWLDSAKFVVLYQQTSQSYSGQEPASLREHSSVFTYFTQARLHFEPVSLSPEMLRKGSQEDEDLPVVFAKRQEQDENSSQQGR